MSLEEIQEIEATLAKLQAEIAELKQHIIYENQWSPKGGSWYISTNSDSAVKSATSEASKEFGVERETKAEAEVAYKAIRSHSRLLAYVNEFDKDWEADWNDSKQLKYYIHFDVLNNTYDCIYNSHIKNISNVYMSKQCAINLVNKLNNGEVVL